MQASSVERPCPDPEPSSSGAPLPARPFTRVDRWLRYWLNRVFGPIPLRFVLDDGTVILPSSVEPPVATVRLHDRRVLVAMLRNPERRFGEGYSRGAIDVDGDLVGGIEAVYHALGRRPRRFLPGYLWNGSHSLADSRDNVHRHYDLGNDFYRLWLDREM